MRKSLTKDEKLKKPTEIKNLFSSGKPYSCKGLKVLFTVNQLPLTRVLFSPSRNHVNAVARNAIKRQAREIYRHVKYQVKPGYDIVFVFFPGTYTFQERQEQMLSLLVRTHLMEKN